MPMPDLSKENTFLVLGEEDLVLGFSALGFKVVALKEPQELAAAIDEAVKSGAGICLVQDNFYLAQEEKINSYRKLPLPIFIPFSRDTKVDLLKNIVRDIRIRATGAF